MKKYKQILSCAAAIAAACTLTGKAFADSGLFVEIIPTTGGASIFVDTDKGQKKISPYIYGINDIGDLKNISPTVIKQRGVSLSSYNWETNYSNSGAEGMNANDISLVDDYPSSKWETPGLCAEKLAARSRMNNIPVKLLTLPMMGYAAADSMGIVANDESSKNTRWKQVLFSKNDTYLNHPDINDDTVYIDEYVSFLVNRFGTASEGGINGYFLDSEPDKWNTNFPVLNLSPLTFSELADRSASLANAVKAIDSNAFVFGPSVSGLQGCIDLGNPSDTGLSAAEGEYSWFIDYYLSEMRARSAQTGYRLLDVLDVHYYTEAQTPLGEDIRTGTDQVANALRMQSVRTLWDPDYTETSVTVMMNKQFTPVIPNLQASIRMNYPKTRLSFSEYDFGGGENMSGAIAEIDALGVFAEQEVYLACLSPLSDKYPFQKAALNLYTDYDGNGSGFGDTLVFSENHNDELSSVYAAVDSDEPEKLRIILTNKQMVTEKDFDIVISSEKYSYELESAFAINSDNADIEECDIENFTYDDNTVSFTADPLGAYILVLNGTSAEETDISESVWTTESTESDTDISEESHLPEDSTVPSETQSLLVISDMTESETEVINPSDETVPDLTESQTESSETAKETVSETELTESTSISEDTSHSDPQEEEAPPSVPLPLKIIISMMCLTVIGGVIYILIFDRK
ncbi:MAG: glycoside hydrolase family 44 protein [Oscillospiraceae bacterium]|nr:glycoside hydrolase family 44 protein [Oscillospiraceae bacterium]